MDKQIYITPKLLKSVYADEIELKQSNYRSLFSETGLIGGFTPEEFVFRKFLNSVKKLALQINKVNLESLNQNAVDDAVFRLEVAALTQIDKENCKMKFDMSMFITKNEILNVLQVFTPNVIQYVALKHGLKLKDGTTFFANNHPTYLEKELVPCKPISEKNLITSIGKKLKINYTEFLPDEKPILKSGPSNNK